MRFISLSVDSVLLLKTLTFLFAMLIKTESLSVRTTTHTEYSYTHTHASEIIIIQLFYHQQWSYPLSSHYSLISKFLLPLL